MTQKKTTSYYQALTLVPLCLGLIGCNQNQCCYDEVICQSYVHPYGLEISGREWCDQGSSGEVITKLKDGRIVREHYEGGCLEGDVCTTYPHREIPETVETYQSGRLVKEKQHYASGLPSTETEYVSETEVIIREYYDQGTPKSVERFTQGRLQQGKYYNLSQNVESGVEDFYGKRTTRDVYGQLLSIDTIKDGLMTSSMTYHPNGMPEAETSYRDGLVHGIRKTFLPGGEPHALEEWNSGFQSGTTNVFDNGEKIAEIQYDRGKKHGLERRFRDETIVVEEISWQNDIRHGPTFRYVDGSVITDWYFNGNPVSKAVYDKRSSFLRN